jgi:predicted AlkP superfamily phosphohydrolase/phosphomutase
MKVLVIGLDCGEPSLAFEKYIQGMPNLRSLMEAGAWGRLESTMPPITVPAWTSMVSGYDPGELGTYGFRNRRRGSYELDFATSAAVRVPRLWDHLGRHGKESIVFAVPQTYPPPAVMRGKLVGCFLTPDAGSRYAYPAGLREELHARFGPYIVDVENFRTDDKKALLGRIYEMSEQHYRMCLWLMKEYDWDFFMMVDMGVDRFHHGFWKYIDPGHPKHEKGSPFEGAGFEYYGFHDRWIGRLLAEVPSDTTVLVVSDHGAKRMKGGICVNEWLMEKGYLAIKGPKPRKLTKISKVEIDWKKTRVWGEGGYYARIFFNVKGREPEGIVEEGEPYEALRREVASALEDMRDGEGRPLGNRVMRAEEIYRKVEGFPPDLIVLFGNLDYRSVGSLGTGSVITTENDTGPDDANHDFYGMLAISGGKSRLRGRIEGARIYDIAPTVCKLLDVPYDEPTAARSLL